ncbi:MAG: MFS transporter [Chloroflexota bacterium]|nr:MFS transporter [Chloroflexota bacterium]
MPSWYTRYRILVWMCVLIAVNQLGFGSIVPVAPLYAASFGVSPSAIGLTIALYGLARFLLAVPAGRLTDRIGRRGTLALGGGVTVVGNLLCAVAPSYVLFLGARFVAGAGAALILTAAQIVLADISPPAQRGRMMGIYSGVFAFAVGVGPYPGGLLAEHFGLNAPFFAYAALASVVTLVAWLRVPETRAAHLKPGTSVAALPSFVQQIRLLTASTGFLLVSLIGFAAAVARTGAVFNVVPVMVKQRLDLAPDQIGLGLSLVSLGALVLAYPSGVLVDYFGRKAVIVPATLTSGVAAGLFALTPSFGWYLFACGVWAFALGVASDAPGAYAADTAPAGMNAAVMSTYRMLSDAGYVLGPLALGIIADGLGAPSALAAAGSLLGVSALLFLRFAPEGYRPRRGLG